MKPNENHRGSTPLSRTHVLRRIGLLGCALLLACTAGMIRSGAATLPAGAVEGSATNRAVAKPPSPYRYQTLPAANPASNPDTELTRTLRKVLNEDPATRSFAADSAVQSQTAILKGRTFETGAREQAQRAAARIPGIRAVRNFIVTETNADLAIAERVRALLAQEPGVSESSIGVTVIHHKVFLSGSAATTDQATRVGELAQGVPGVEGVSNGLDVAGAKGHVPATAPRMATQPGRAWSYNAFRR